MVHIGAIVAAIMTRKKWPGTHRMLELRMPQPQREWIGMGAAAGVAAAFNAPFGGILYSFEEVCSSWTAQLTWRSFVCCMLVAMTYARPPTHPRPLGRALPSVWTSARQSACPPVPPRARVPA